MDTHILIYALEPHKGHYLQSPINPSLVYLKRYLRDRKLDDKIISCTHKKLLLFTTILLNTQKRTNIAIFPYEFTGAKQKCW